jgi:hypothetical protein
LFKYDLLLFFMNKREKERIEKAFNWVQRKLNTKYNLIFKQFVAANDQEVSEDTHLCVERTVRDTEDPDCFLVYFDTSNTIPRSFKTLKQDALHEMIHVISWIRRDVFDDTIKHVKPLSLRKELTKRFYDADEKITYTMERSVGPFIVKGFSREI